MEKYLNMISILATNRECPTIGRIGDKLEYRLPEEVVRPDFAAILDEDNRFIARIMYLKMMENNLSIFAEIEKKKPKFYAFIEMNVSERSEAEIKKAKSGFSTNPGNLYSNSSTIRQIVGHS